ncbi:MAG: SLC13 family permease [bacterium]|nr:SLC13 family permease [bacterium]
MLTTPEIVLIAIIGTAILFILSNRIRADVVAIMVLLALQITGVLTTEEAFSGFSRQVIFTLIGLFIMSYALEVTGVVSWIASRVTQIGGGRESRLMLIILGAGAALALIMNIIAAGAVLLPVAVQVARDSGVRASKLLIPLSYGTLLGATATIFATANIVMSGILQDQGYSALAFSDFLPTGIPIILLGVGYMLVIGRKLLPDREGMGGAPSSRGLARSLYETYQLKERMWELRVLPTSRLVGVRLADSDIGEALGLSVVAIWRGGHAILAPSPDEVIAQEDFLLVLGREDRVRVLLLWGTKLAREDGDLNTPRHDYSVDLTEVIIAPRSSVIGKTLYEIGFRNKYGLTAVALWRGGRSYRTDVGKFKLEEGDALLMVGPVRNIRTLQKERDYIVLTSSHTAQPPMPHKAPLAVVITLAVVLLSIFEVLPSAEAMLIGAVAMVITGCVNMDDAYRGITWRVIFLIAGMIPVSIALVNTGLADRLGGLVVALTAPYGQIAVIAGIFLLTMALTQVLSGQVTAIIMGPVAIAAALQTGIDPLAMGVAAATACSAAFLIPTAHPVNALMMGPGGYVPSDFTKVGIGMTLVVFAALMAGMMIFWGIR